MIDSSIEREIVIWLAGLISTDGCVRHSNKDSLALQYQFCSVEPDWINLVKEKLAIIEIPSTILHQKRFEHGDFLRREKKFRMREYSVCQLYLNNPRKITLLFDKYNCKEWFNPRKWKIIEAGIEYYKEEWILHQSGNRSLYSTEEIETIIKNSTKSVGDIMKVLNADKPRWLKRSYYSIREEKEKLRESGQIKRFCQFCGNPIPKEKKNRGKYCSLKCCYAIRNQRIKEYKIKWQRKKRAKLRLDALTRQK
jgi:hypothetical protein